MPFAVASDPSPQLRAALSFLDAAGSYDTEKVSNTLASTFQHQFYPSSLARPALNKASFLNLLKTSLWPLVNGFKVHILG